MLESHGCPFEHCPILMTTFLGTWRLLMVPSEDQAYGSHPNSRPAGVQDSEQLDH